MSKFSRNLAFIIGINNYGNGISPLKTAVNDAQKIVEIIRKKHGYKVWVCLDKVATLSNLNQLLEKTLPEQVTKNDRLLFYFAGHGVALNGDDDPAGYLIPQDAKQGDTSSYLPMTKLHDALSKLPCRHFLGILDCCFAGAFRWSSTRDLLATPEVIHKERYDRFITDPAWQIITSSASDQKALDNFDFNVERGQVGNHSPFAEAFLEALEGAADAYPPTKNGKPAGDGVITATELYLYLRDRVEIPTEKYRLRQTPGIWCLNKHDKGEYIFLTPGHQLNLPPAPPLDKSKNPYRGLKSFEEHHSQLFFGRTELIEKLQNFVKTQPLTVVLGASGSGKSSLVKAGLIPKLKQDKDKWCILSPIRPGETPFQALNNALVDEFLLKVELQNKQKTLAQSVAVWAKHHPQSKLLIFIDQTEEIITLCQDENQRQEFFRQILIALNTHRHKLRIVLTLRSDFEPQVRDAGLKFVSEELKLRNTLLKNRWQHGRFIVPAMTRGELREAIEKPASARVMYFQPYDLVEQLIDEVADMPGALPLLSFALSELYLKYLKRQREAQYRGITIDRALTQEDYQELGGVIQSLTQRADEEYQGLVEENPAYEQVIRHVMLRMVAIGGGELARRRVPLSELEYPLEKNSLVKEVIKRFSQARLLVEGQDAEGNPYVEPAHDALVRGWEKLLAWKENEAGSLILQRRLTPAAQEWKNFKSQEQLSGLQVQAKLIVDWLDCQLNVMENLFKKINLKKINARINTQFVRLLSRKAKQFLWNANPYLDVLYEELKSNENCFNQVEAEFVQESVGQKRHNISWRWRIAIGVIIGLSGLFSIATIFLGLSKINEAKVLRESAEINLQENQSLDGLEDSLEASKILNNKGLQLLLRIEQLWSQTNLREKVRGTLLRAVYTVRESDRQQEERGTVRASISPDEQKVISAGENGTVRIWQLKGQTLSEWNSIDCEPENCEPVKIARFSPNGQKLATAGAKGTVRVWNIQGKELTEFEQLNTEQGEVKSIGFSPNGKLMATTGADGTIRLWNLNNLSEKPEILGLFDCTRQTNDVIWSVEFSPDGKKLACTGDNGTIGLWERKENKWQENLRFFPESDRDLTSIDFSPNSEKIATAGKDGIILLWDIRDSTSARKLTEIDTEQDQLWDVSFSQNGQKLASAGENGTIRLWDLNSQELESEELAGHQGPVRTASFLANDRQILSAGDDGSIRLWNLQGNESGEFRIPIKTLTGDREEVMIQNGSQKAFGNKNGTVELQQLPDRQPIKMKSSHVNAVTSLAFSPDGEQLASGAKDRTIRLWNDKGEQEHLLPTSAPVSSVAYSSNQQLLASAGEDGTVQLWNLQQLQDAEPFAAWKAYGGAVKNVRFSKDNQVLITVGEDSTTTVCKLWQIESFNNLMKQAEAKVHGYLKHDSQIDERHLCNGI